MKLKQLAQIFSLICIAGSALAQTPAPVAPPTAPAAKPPAPKPEKIEVTGSSIKRVDQDSALPLQIITRADIEREGISTTEQLISFLSSNGSGLDNLASNADVVAVSGAGRGNNGASSANLRGQGSAATLILLNGRRVAAHGLNGGAVDIQQIPLAAIERVEVLKDGASAIYGTDAVGGVINFILQKNFQGLRGQAFMDVTEQGGGNIFRGSLVGGFGDIGKDGFNVMGTLTWSENKELNGADRGFVNTFQSNRGLSVDTRGTPNGTILPLGVGPYTTAGTILASAGTSPFLPGSTTIRASGGINILNLPGQEGCSSIAGMAAYDFLLWDFPTHRFACAWDTGKASVIQQQVKNVNYVTRAVMRLGDHQAVVEFTGSKVESMRAGSNIQLIPNTAALTSATSLNYALFRNPTSAATYDMVFNRLVAVFPTLEARRGLPISYRWRCMDCGRREIATETETGRLFAGLDGPIPFIDGWDYRAGASTAYSDSESTLGSGYIWRNTRRDASGTIVVNGIVDALNSGVINPFLLPGQTQTAAGLAAIAATSAAGTKLYQGRYSVRQIDASASGPLWKLPAGEIMAAVGVDFRTETFKFTGNPSPNGRIESEILGAPFDNGNALDGKTRDIKAAYTEILIPVLRQLEVTAAVRRDDYSGFGATTNPKYSFKFTPGAGLLFRGSYNTGFRVPSFNQIFNAPVESPYLGADLADPSKCPGGRPISNRPGCELISPLIIGGGKPDLGPETASQQSLGFVWDVTKNVSINVDWWSIDRKKTIQSFDIRTLVDNFGLFPERFIRNAAGNVAAIDTRWINAGQTITKGLEIGARANWSGLGGRWSTGLDGTYLLEKKSRLLASAPFGSSEVGVFTYGGDLGIRWKHNAFLTYKTGAWSTSMSQIYRRGYANNLLPGVVSGVVLPPDLNRRVDDYILYNASVAYSGIKNLTLTGGIRNLFNTDPPFATNYDSIGGTGSSWEPRATDPRGRSFTLNIQYKFL